MLPRLKIKNPLFTVNVNVNVNANANANATVTVDVDVDIDVNPLDAGRRYTGFLQASKRRQTPVYRACANFSTSPATGIPGLCKLISPARHRYTGFIF